MDLPTCLTCTRITQVIETVPICHYESVQSALSKYFWFNDEESASGILCQTCWHKIDDFHKFYCEIEQLHSHRQQDPIQLLQVKQEANHDSLFVAELQEDPYMDVDVDVKVKCEFEEEAEDDSEDNDEEDNENSNLCDEIDFKEYNTSKSKVPRKNNEKPSKDDERAEIDEFIATNINVQCDTCSEQYSSFKDLQRHSMGTHKQPAYLFCCDRRFRDWRRLVDHIRFHLNPDRFACTKCSKRCPSSETLTSHMSIKHATEEEKTFQCDICPKKFSRLRLLTMHKKSHARGDDVESDSEGSDNKEENASDEKELQQTTDEKEDKGKNFNKEEFIAQNINLECDTCHKQAKTFQELQEHSLSEHKKRADVLCCDRKFNWKPQLIEHIQFHLNPSQFQCDICLKQFHHKKGLMNHKDKKHSAEEAKTFKCSECPKTFSKKVFLSTHERYHRRLKEKTWHCQECDKYFAFESMLQQHNRSVHTKEFNYVCHVCAKGFQVLSSYTWHMENRHGEGTSSTTAKRDKAPEEPIQCVVCGTSVLSKRSLKEHMLRHSGTQRCDQCGQECKSVMALRYHQAQHKKGDFLCSVCGKGFKQQLTLKEHMASHTGEVLYRCDFCDRTFNSRANRAAHRKKMHPKEWLEDKLQKNPRLQLQMDQQMLNQM